MMIQMRWRWLRRHRPSWSAIVKVRLNWLTGRLRSTQIHLWHGVAEAKSIELQGCTEEAIRSFVERAIRMSPVDPRLHLLFAGMGSALVELRRFDEAVAAGKKPFVRTPPI